MWFLPHWSVASFINLSLLMFVFFDIHFPYYLVHSAINLQYFYLMLIDMLFSSPFYIIYLSSLDIRNYCSPCSSDHLVSAVCCWIIRSRNISWCTTIYFLIWWSLLFNFSFYHHCFHSCLYFPNYHFTKTYSYGVEFIAPF